MVVPSKSKRQPTGSASYSQPRLRVEPEAVHVLEHRVLAELLAHLGPPGVDGVRQGGEHEGGEHGALPRDADVEDTGLCLIAQGHGHAHRQQIRLAVFGINGPISAGPNNFIWVRSATLEVRRARQERPGEVARVLRADPAFDSVVPPDARIEKIADGFLFTEGPVWHPGGYLLFSDPNANTIYRWSPDGQASIYRAKSGYKGIDVGEYGQPGSNGLTLDREGRLTINEHGNRRVTRLEKNGSLTVLADRYEGKRLNSPNDLVYRSDGALYFTDPPFGLPKAFDDARKELPFSGVFCLKDGKLQLVSTDLTGPNGIAFSPDERFLYVTNWDEKRKVVMRYEVQPKSCELTTGRVFFDMTKALGEEALDGMKVDRQGHLFVSGPGGVWVISSEGKHLGTIIPSELPANMAFGDAEGRTLYMTARTGIYRMRLAHEGIRPPLASASR